MSKGSCDHFESVEIPLEQRQEDASLKDAEWTKADNGVDLALQRKVLRKIDWLVIPFICVTYLFTYLDKTMLGYSAVYGLKEDLHLQGTEYSWLGSIFYFGYLIFEYPTLFAMQKFPVSKWLSANIVIWGGLTMALAGCSKFSSFLGVRFLLGALESCSSPAYLLITATWYTVEEQPIRIGWWSTFLGLANSFGGLLAFAIGHIHGPLASWQYQFIIVGAISSAWGLFMFFALAEGPSTAPWLSKAEKEAAILRLGPGHQGANNREIKKYQILEAFADPKTWFIFLFGVSTQVVNGAASNFGSLIIKGFGFSSLVTTLFQVPYGIVILIANVSAMYIQRWLPGQSRCFVAAAYVVPALAGAVGIHTIDRDHKTALLVCYWLTGTYTASFAMVMSLIVANTGGSTKRSAVNAVFFISYCVGNIIGPFSFKSNEAPTYTSGIVAMLTAYCVEIALLLGFAVYMARLSRKKKAALERQDANLSDLQSQPVDEWTDDRTDWENPHFKYSY